MPKTALTLTEDQLERMVRYVRARIESMDAARNTGWLADRERFDREWNDDFSHREWESAVFAKSNESLNMVGSGVDFIRSRMMEEIFGSKPWFFVDPRSPAGRDPVLADQVTKHLRWKLGPDQVDFEGVARDLVTQACKMGECVAKVFYKSEEETYERIASILWDPRTNAPVLTPDGELIFEASDTTNPEDRLKGESGNEPSAAESSTPAPGCCWKEQIVSERVKHYTGAKAVPLHYQEFYCPLNAASIHEADFVAHLTSMRLSELCVHLGVSLDGAPDGGEEASAPGTSDYFTQALRQIQRESALPKTAPGQPLPVDGDGEDASTDPEFRLLEAYFSFDARGDGRPCRVFLMMAYDIEVPIFWDYIANITPEGRYPFEAVVMNKEPYRWYGKSWFQKYEKFQHLIDKLMNQILYRNDLAANPVKFRRKEAVVQWQDDQPFEIGPDKVFDLNDWYTAADALQTATIPKLDEQTKFLLDMVIANWRTRSGISAVAQGTFGGLPSERTATGITQIVSSGATLIKPQVMEVKRGLEAVLRQVVEYQYACQEGDETFTYLDGNARVQGTLSRESVRDLEFDLELTLTRSKQMKSLDAAKMAVDFFGKFLAVPDAFKPVAAPLFTTIYKSLEIDNADDYFQQVVKIAQRGSGPDQAPGATAETVQADEQETEHPPKAASDLQAVRGEAPADSVNDVLSATAPDATGSGDFTISGTDYLV